ncbi:MAG: S41 family peptidase [Gemmataceae bacterium]
MKKILGVPGTRSASSSNAKARKSCSSSTSSAARSKPRASWARSGNADDTWNYVVDPENKICYVRLTQFSSNTYHDLDNVMRKLSKAGIKGFILDLRFNPGGLLDQAVKISDLFIEDGLIVTIRPRNGAETSYVGRSDGSYTAFPMVCLVNGGPGCTRAKSSPPVSRTTLGRSSSAPAATARAACRRFTRSTRAES